MTTKDIKYWLEEKELKTPEHDKIVLWCHRNPEKIINITKKGGQKYLHFYSGYGENIWDWETKTAKGYRKDEIEESYLKFVELCKEERKPTISVLLEQKLGFGFVDLIIYEDLHLIDIQYFSEIIRDEKNKIIHSQRKYILEVKPEIKSIGEVMRQINFYRSYAETTNVFILVTKTKGLKEIFESQQIFVYEFEDETNEQIKSKENQLKL